MNRHKQAIVLLSNPMTLDIRPMMTARYLSQNGYDVTALYWDHEGQNLRVEELSNKGLCLPSSSGLKTDEITYVCDSISDIKNKVLQ